jgi:hypothetical protein
MSTHITKFILLDYIKSLFIFISWMLLTKFFTNVNRWLIWSYLIRSLSPLTLWVWIPLRWGVLDTTLCDNFFQLLAAGQWVSLLQSCACMWWYFLSILNGVKTFLLLQGSCGPCHGYQLTCPSSMDVAIEVRLYWYPFRIFFSDNTRVRI